MEVERRDAPVSSDVCHRAKVDQRGTIRRDFDIIHFLFKLQFLHLCREGKDMLLLCEAFAICLHGSSFKFLELVYTIHLGDDKL